MQGRKVCDRMSSMIGQGKIKEVQAEAYNWTNPRFASKILTEDKMEDTESEDLAGDDCNLFDALAIVKKGADRYGSTYIYRLNNGSMNNGSDNVFLCSTKMVEVAV